MSSYIKTKMVSNWNEQIKSLIKIPNSEEQHNTRSNKLEPNVMHRMKKKL